MSRARHLLSWLLAAAAFAAALRWFVAATVAMLVLYVAIMWLAKERERTPVVKRKKFYWAYPLVAFGYVLDVVWNRIFGTILFGEPPTHWWETLTECLARYHRTEAPGAYRYTVAHFLCQRVLDPFDPTGDHC